jgi:hypothetical protein
MRGTQQGGGAKAKNQDRHRKDDGGEQKRKPGSMDASSTLLDLWRAIDARERGDHSGRIRGARAAANQADLRVSQPVHFLLLNLRSDVVIAKQQDFRCAEASLPQLNSDHK